MSASNPIAWLAFACAVTAAWGKDALAVASKKAPLPTSTLEGLQPDFRERIESFMDDAAKAGVPLRVDETFRTYLRQAWLHEAYLTGGVVAAPPGNSRHEKGRAADLWPVGVLYTDPNAANILDGLTSIAARHGLKNLGSIGDHDHWEDA